MSSLATQHGRRMMGGAARMLLAQALVVPTGLLSAALLARWLNPSGYGVFTLASALVAWVEWCIPSAFARASTKFIAASDDPSEVGAAVLRLHTAAGVGVGVLLWLAAPWVSTTLGEPALAGALRLFAFDVPLFAAVNAHRAILTGTGKFNEVSLATAARWVVRLLLLAALVGLGLSVAGAVVAIVLTSLVELVILRRHARPRLFGRAGFPVRRLLAFGLPLFLAAMSLRLFDKLDIFALKSLGATTREAGFYGAAQNLTLAASLFALTFSPVLLATVSRTLREGDEALARRLSRDAMRVVLWLLPFAAAAAGAAEGIVRLVFGEEFAPAAEPLAPLVFGAIALLMLSVATNILVAADRPGWTLALAAPLPALALAGHFVLIPRLGMRGAGVVTAAAAIAGSLAAVACVRLRWRVSPPAATLLRCALVAALAYWLAAVAPAQGWPLALKLAGVALAIPLALLLLGEFGTEERQLARSVLLRRRAASGTATTTEELR